MVSKLLWMASKLMHWKDPKAVIKKCTTDGSRLHTWFLYWLHLAAPEASWPASGHQNGHLVTRGPWSWKAFLYHHHQCQTFQCHFQMDDCSKHQSAESYSTHDLQVILPKQELGYICLIPQKTVAELNYKMEKESNSHSRILIQ